MQANGMTSDRLCSFLELKIPLYAKEDEGRKRRNDRDGDVRAAALLQRMRPALSRPEALAYLAEACGCLERACSLYDDDAAWEHGAATGNTKASRISSESTSGITIGASMAKVVPETTIELRRLET